MFLKKAISSILATTFCINMTINNLTFFMLQQNVFNDERRELCIYEFQVEDIYGGGIENVQIQIKGEMKKEVIVESSENTTENDFIEDDFIEDDFIEDDFIEDSSTEESSMEDNYIEHESKEEVYTEDTSTEYIFEQEISTEDNFIGESNIEGSFIESSFIEESRIEGSDIEETLEQESNQLEETTTKESKEENQSEENVESTSKENVEDSKEESIEEASEEGIESSKEESIEEESEENSDSSTAVIDVRQVHDVITTNSLGYAISNVVKEGIEEGYTIDIHLSYIISHENYATLEGVRVDWKNAYTVDILPLGFQHKYEEVSYSYERRYAQAINFSSSNVKYSIVEGETNDSAIIDENSGVLTLKKPGTVYIEAEGRIDGKRVRDSYELKIVKGERQFLFLPQIQWNDKGELDVWYGLKQLENPIYMVVDKNNPSYPLWEDIEKIQYTSKSDAFVGKVDNQGKVQFFSGKKGKITVKASLKEDDYYKKTEVFYNINVKPFIIENIEDYIQINNDKPTPNTWYNKPIEISISNNIGEYEISKSEDFINNIWKEKLTIQQECLTEDIMIYLRNKETGMVTEQVIIPYSSVQIDTKQPENIEIIYSKPIFGAKINGNNFKYYNENVFVTIKAEDSGSGIRDVFYTMTTFDEEEEILKEQIPIKVGSKQIKETFSISAKYQGFIGVVISDLAGNVNSYSEIERKNGIVVDNESPKLEVRYEGEVKNVISSQVTDDNLTPFDSNASNLKTSIIYKGKVKVVLSIEEENFFKEDVNVQISKDGSVIQNISMDWIENGNNHYISSVVLEEDGDYEIKIIYKDRSGNKMQWICKEPINQSGEYEYGSNIIKIDKIPLLEENVSRASEVNVVFNEPSNVIDNVHYYNQHIKGLIQVKGVDIYTENIDVVINNASILMDKWIKEGENWVASFVLEEENTYNIIVTYKDVTLHESIQYQSPVLILDKTAPIIKVDGITNQSANNQIENIGFQVTIEDKHINTNTLQISMLGTFRKEDGSFYTQNIEDGKLNEVIAKEKYIYTVKNLEEDGFYEFFCRVEDLAGNEGTTMTVKEINKNTKSSIWNEAEKVEFSVNRKGSVFQISDYAKEIIQYYYIQQVEKDIEIVEVNADLLQDYNIMLNGILLEELKDYRVEKIDGVDEWNRYVYKINKTLFQQDGEYIITVTSLDNAQNKGYSDIKQAKIHFVVDSTPPSITYSGIWDNGIYNETERKVILFPVDSGGKLQSLVVQVMNEKGEILHTPINSQGEELLNTLLKGKGIIEFSLKEGNNQFIKIVCKDSSKGNGSIGNVKEVTIQNVSVTKKDSKHSLLKIANLLTKNKNSNSIVVFIGVSICILFIVFFYVIREIRIKYKNKKNL